MIRCEKLSVLYGGKKILHEISFKPKERKLTVIVGPNGSGKSTLLKAMSGQLKPISGTVFLDEKAMETYGSRELAKRIAYLPQNRNDTNLCVGRLVLHGRFPYIVYPRHYTAQDEEKVEDALKKMGILHYKNKPVSELSGGERQKVYLAMAIVQEAPYFFLDEPTTYLDLSFQLELLQQLKQLVQDGKTVVAILHDLNAALQYADEMVLLAEGRIIQTGTPKELLQSGKLEKVFRLKIHSIQDEKGNSHYWFSGENKGAVWNSM